MSSNSLKEAIKSRDPEKIMIEVLRFMVALYSFHCECFTGETLVSTTEGDKSIDEIEVGDYVYAYDTETEETVPARVTYVSVTETNILVHVYTSEGEEIKTTMLHPFYVKNVKNGEDEEYGIWKASANLVAGDELLTEDGRVVYVEEVRIERLAESIKVYNLEVEGLHTYYVGSGVLVHNDYAIENGNNTGDKKTPVDLYSFGNKSTPRGARPQQDFGVENFDSVIEAQIGPFPNGASNVIDVNTTPLKGFFHKLPAGTTLPEGLDVIADGIDVFQDSPHGAGHYTIFPTRNMTVDEFNELFKSLDWELGGKK